MPLFSTFLASLALGHYIALLNTNYIKKSPFETNHINKLSTFLGAKTTYHYCSFPLWVATHFPSPVLPGCHSHHFRKQNPNPSIHLIRLFFDTPNKSKIINVLVYLFLAPESPSAFEKLPLRFLFPMMRCFWLLSRNYPHCIERLSIPLLDLYNSTEKVPSISKLKRNASSPNIITSCSPITLHRFKLLHWKEIYKKSQQLL
jgi:hypothetical protein